ncbi:MAG: N-acetyl-alpha-D-glucosaminyl L-malate synthase BshA, partial [Sphingobacteriia bacterium]|nr:N-acetyl-alpha-D-glucosaminyl L-malate synthase BshA [Sphingobacteriia bacterium]
KMVDVARFQHLDLLHVHYAIPHASSAIMAREILRKAYQIYVPILTTLHGTDITLVGKDQSFNPVVRYSIGESDGVSAVSDYLRQATIDTFHTDCDIRVIPNFIDLKRFKLTNKSHFKQILAPNGEKVIIHTSNFRKVKRIEDVIFVFKKVLEKIPAKLLMVGDGPERAKAEDLCRQMDLCEDIRFLGKQQSVEELLAISDLFLMPSGSESFGLAALEAMACSLPVISSDTGGLPELNVSGETGFLLPVGDVEGMAAAALQLLLDEKLLAKFSKNAEKRAQKFSLEEIVPLYENYYVEILENSVSKHPINHSSF